MYPQSRIDSTHLTLKDSNKSLTVLYEAGLCQSVFLMHCPMLDHFRFAQLAECVLKIVYLVMVCIFHLTRVRLMNNPFSFIGRGKESEISSWSANIAQMS